jgi:DNA-binding GntR family transcriptional regulator
MIVRERLSADVHQEIINRIIKGDFFPGQRLKDTELAEELGVSRTPIREALLRLEREGFISSQKHLGFTVKRMEESEILEVYPLVSLLECSALDTVPPTCAEKLGRLRDLTSALEEEEGDALRRIELDSSWHKILLDGSGNHHLMRILGDLKRILLRYEYSFMGDDDLVATSIAEHAAIAACLGAGERGEAVRLLGVHWDRSRQATLANFHEHGEGQG